MNATATSGSAVGAGTSDGVGFLSLPPRSAKPRSSGITHVLDKGLPPALLRAHLEQVADAVDFLKLGWGTGHVDRALRERVQLCRGSSVQLCTGGTFLEIAVAQGRTAEFVRWARANEIAAVEVSNGLGLIDRPEKRALIRMLAPEFVVLAETGQKNPLAQVVAADWAGEMCDDLEAGASLVVAEGRESGTVGLFEPDGQVRDALVDAIAREVPLDRVVFEAPRKTQQAWLINHLGPSVNLGNIELGDVLPVETLRLGLRADTAGLTTAGIPR